jgi:hypothetical protein
LITLIVDARRDLLSRTSFDRRKDQFLRDLSDRGRLSPRICVRRAAPFLERRSNKPSLHDVRTTGGAAVETSAPRNLLRGRCILQDRSAGLPSRRA